MAFYMAVERAARVQADLLAAGTPADCPVDIVAHASTDREQHVETTLADLADAVARNDIHSPAILFVRYPKDLAPARALPVSA
jgi:siroheme synthase